METEASRCNPLTLTIQEAVRISGLSRSELYRRLSDGKVQAVKSGARTLITMDSLRAHLASLPVATFRAPRGA
jgi:excisionase family DNA binding protein